MRDWHWLNIDRNELLHTHMCRLDDGTVTWYDIASGDEDAYDDNDAFEYIGRGIIWTINGVNQNSDTPLHFWQRVKRKRTDG